MQAFQRNSVLYKQHTFHSLIPTQRITVIAIQKVIPLNFPNAKARMNIFRVASLCHLAGILSLSLCVCHPHFYGPLSHSVIGGREMGNRKKDSQRERERNTPMHILWLNAAYNIVDNM